MIAGMIARLRALLNLPARVDAQFGRFRRELDALEGHVQDIQDTLKRHDVRQALESYKQHAERLSKEQRADYAKLQRELAATRKEVRDRLPRSRGDSGRATGSGSGIANGDGHSTSASVPEQNAPEPAAASVQWEWLKLDRCPGCGTPERTIVCEWNKSILLERDVFADLPHYDYALCHGCGIVYATCRPVGAGYKALTTDFSETIGRGAGANAGNALLNPYPLSDADRERYRRLIVSGVFVSDHQAREHLDGVYQDRLDNAAHLEILASLLDLRQPSVLEVRSRAGTILHGLRRGFGASVKAMPIFEGQQLILRELYGIESSDIIDYDMFTIPFEETFDLIVCNHMLTHIVRVDRLFEQVRAHLKVGGHLYMYNELDENKFLGGGNSVINTLNALHLQVFDRDSLIRLLNANGFEVIFAKMRNGSLLYLARHTHSRTWTPMDAPERDRRVRAYALARTRAILRAPKAVRSRFGSLWDDAVADGVAAGIARFDESGRPRVIKPGVQ
jgi:SAM-dependent methyltransferase